MSVALVALFAALFNILLEAMIISFTIALLRKFSGGAHSSSPTGCLIIGTAVTLVLAAAVSRLAPVAGEYILIIYTLFCAVFSLTVLKAHAPVDHPNKPIKTHSRRKKLKVSSIIFTGVVSLAAVSSAVINALMLSSEVIVSVSVSLVTGLLWQSFTLLKAGHLLISAFDAFFRIPIKHVGGETR